MDISHPRDKSPAPVTERVESAPGQAGGNPIDVRRRRLLRGMAALPAVYTLGSGAQTAALSNYQCVTKPPLLGGDPALEGVLHVPDTAGVCAEGYQRGVPSYQGVSLPNANNQQYLLFNYTPGNIVGTYYDQNGETWVAERANGNGGPITFTQQVVGGQSFTFQNANQVPFVDVRPAVYVDDQGGVAFYPDRGTLDGPTALSCSCWSSFNPATTNPFA